MWLFFFWREDDGGYRWYLGVVNELFEKKDGNDILVSFYKRGNESGTSWNYPEEVQLRLINYAQILEKKSVVSYHCYSIIRCSITKEKVMDIIEKLVTNANYL